ncbi:hypothetical protein ACFL6N_05420 [Thermodesulfobacteriota bacterium]
MFSGKFHHPDIRGHFTVMSFGSLGDGFRKIILLGWQGTVKSKDDRARSGKTRD